MATAKHLGWGNSRLPEPTPLNNGCHPRKGRVTRERAGRVEEFLSEMQRATKKSTDVVYVIQAVDGGPVKIGHTTYRGVDRRLAELQTGSPRQLVVRALYEGGMWLERAMHEFFADVRLVGEWFSVTPSLVLLCPEVSVDGG